MYRYQVAVDEITITHLRQYYNGTCVHFTNVNINTNCVHYINYYK